MLGSQCFALGGTSLVAPQLHPGSCDIACFIDADRAVHLAAAGYRLDRFWGNVGVFEYLAESLAKILPP